jgi:hypothetical protein
MKNNVWGFLAERPLSIFFFRKFEKASSVEIGSAREK